MPIFLFPGCYVILHKNEELVKFVPETKKTGEDYQFCPPLHLLSMVCLWLSKPLEQFTSKLSEKWMLAIKIILNLQWSVRSYNSTENNHL